MILVVRITGTCRDQTTHDNVLFQAARFVAFARNGYRVKREWSPNDAAEMKDSVAEYRFGDTPADRGEVEIILPFVSVRGFRSGREV